MLKHKKKEIDILIIANERLSEKFTVYYRNPTNLVINNHIMSIENLKSYFENNKSIPIQQTKRKMSTHNDYLNNRLNGIYLYDYCKKRELECVLINCISDENYSDFSNIMNSHPKCIAISTTYMLNIRQVKKVTSLIRQFDKDVPIVVGGILVYNSYRLYNLKDDPNYDTESAKPDYFFINKDPKYFDDINFFVIEKQGEQTLVQLVTAIKEKKNTDSINNLAFYRKGNLYFTEKKAENNLFHENIISWDKLDEELLPRMP